MRSTAERSVGLRTCSAANMEKISGLHVTSSPTGSLLAIDVPKRRCKTSLRFSDLILAFNGGADGSSRTSKSSVGNKEARSLSCNPIANNEAAWVWMQRSSLPWNASNVVGGSVTMTLGICSISALYRQRQLSIRVNAQGQNSNSFIS